MEESKKRRSDRSSKGIWSAKQLTDSSSIEKWLQARKKIGKSWQPSNEPSKTCKCVYKRLYLSSIPTARQKCPPSDLSTTNLKESEPVKKRKKLFSPSNFTVAPRWFTLATTLPVATAVTVSSCQKGSSATQPTSKLSTGLRMTYK